jgi:hypothetical protein
MLVKSREITLRALRDFLCALCVKKSLNRKERKEVRRKGDAKKSFPSAQSLLLIRINY